MLLVKHEWSGITCSLYLYFYIHTYDIQIGKAIAIISQCKNMVGQKLISKSSCSWKIAIGKYSNENVDVMVCC